MSDQKLPDDLVAKKETDEELVTEEPGKMKPVIHRLLAAWFIIVGALAFGLALRCWPADPNATATAGGAKGSSVKSDTLASRAVIVASDTLKNKKLASEQKAEPQQVIDAWEVLYLSMLFGILGGAAHGLSSLMDFRGNRRLFRSWSLWYFGRPILGGMMSVIFYVVVRAGFFAASASSKDTNLYGIAAFSALVGLFTDKATTKLAELFGTMFTTKDTKTQDRDGKLNP